ncbi:MAG: hypothetical protein ACFFD4_15360 [Candidatus Odinarchaeota archaeon]
MKGELGGQKELELGVKFHGTLDAFVTLVSPRFISYKPFYGRSCLLSSVEKTVGELYSIYKQQSEVATDAFETRTKS